MKTLAFLLAAGLLALQAWAQEQKTENAPADAPAQTQPAAEPAPPVDPLSQWLNGKRLTGDWGGARTDLEEAGFSFQLTYQSHYMHNVHGGRETTNGGDFSGTYDATLLLDLGKMNLVPGGEVFFRFKSMYGGGPNDFDGEKVGGIFRTQSDVAVDCESIYADKYWYRQRLLDDKLEIRLGRLTSAQDLMDVSMVANTPDLNFFNTALGLNPSIPHGNGLGAFVSLWPVEWLNLRAMTFDSQSVTAHMGSKTAFHDEAHYRFIYELGIRPEYFHDSPFLPGSWRIGSWYDPRLRPEYMNTLGGALTQKFDSGHCGIYLGADQMVYKENEVARDKQGLTAFARYGYAPGEYYMMEHFWSTGVSYEGLIPTRDKDLLGLGVAQGVTSGEFQALRQGADRETVYEIYYAIEVTPWCVITPDLQIITNPGGNKADRDAYVVGLRMRLNF